MSNPFPPIVLSIIVITALISFLARNENELFLSLEFNMEKVKKGQFYRLLSSALIHVSLEHLLFNMITLYFFADEVVRVLGVTRFIMLYVASAFTGGLLSLVFHFREDQYRAVGASGAVTGVLYAAILLNPSLKLIILPIPVPIPAYIFGIGYLLYSLYGMRKRMDNIGHSAHFGGAIGGYALTLFWMPSLLETNLNMVVLLAIPVVLLLFIPSGRN